MFWNVKLCRCFLYKKDVWSLLHLSSFSIKYAFIMTGRQLFNETEKVCLQELIIKYKLNSTATTCGGSVTSKKVAWARLTEEFNSIETNSKRTEMQLKKCWDNLKTRRKAMLALQKKERMRTGGGPFNPDIPSTSQSSQEILLDSALTEQTDVELMFAIDSDTPDTHTIEDMQTNLGTGAPQTTENLSIVTESVNEPSTETERVDTPLRQSESRMSDFGISAPSQVSRNIRTKVIEEEFSIRRENYKIKQKRDEELHKLKIAEHTLLVKVAEEKYLKTKIEKEAAEELLLCNKMKKEEAEIKLFELKK